MRKSQKQIILPILFTVIFFASTVLMAGCGEKQNKPPNNETSNPDAEISTANPDEITNNPISEDLNIWNGTYTKGKIEIKLCRTGLDTIDIDITKDYSDDSDSEFGSRTEGYSITLDSAEKLFYEDDFDEKITITISLNNGGIELKASSVDAESLLNEVDGHYAKVEFPSAGWDGVYTNGDWLIVLAEVNSGELYINISSGLQFYLAYFNNYSNEKISFENELFGDTDSISIVRTETGIEMQSSSSGEDSLLNKISGSYARIG